MKKYIGVFIALAPLWPIESYSAGVDIPDIGVHIVEMPSGSALPQVIRRFDGYTAVMPIGIATLTIARVEDPVPSGSDITDASFRAAQRAEFYEQPDPHAHEQRTSVSGHDAWTVVSTRRSGLNVNYSSVTYIIVDQHLYRLVASASTIGETNRAEDFEAAVRVLSELTFTPVVRSSVPPNAGAAGLLKMPRAQMPNNNGDFYPPISRRRYEEGVVDLEYSVDDKGRVRDLQDTYSNSYPLRDAAQALLRKTTFKVKPSWGADGYDKLRFTTEVQYWINRCPRHSAAHTLGAEVITICASER